jgi:tRNA U34 5-carboxymethylaminomethyl modifying enzyme MnmG/GidA
VASHGLGWDGEAMEMFSVETDIKYEGYLRRQHADVARARRNEHRHIPPGFAYAGVPGLSREVQERLAHVAPETLGQASRVPGVTPAAVAILARRIERGREWTNQPQKDPGRGDDRRFAQTAGAQTEARSPGPHA